MNSGVLQKKWFDYYLKGIGDGKFEEAYIFQTGSNIWKTYIRLATKGGNDGEFVCRSGGTASFSKPLQDGNVSYISDPQKPVPYRTLPIEATYGVGSRWRPWQIEDQRFVYYETRCNKFQH